MINPTKSETGKVTKLFVENMNTKIRELSSANKCQDSDTVISLFKNIKNKRKYIFMQFDMKEFYPWISKDQLLKVIDYA